LRPPALRATIAAALLTAGCGDPPTLPIEVTSGFEQGMLADEGVTVVEIVAVEPVEGGIELQGSAAPGEDFNLGEVPDSALLVFELTGKDAAGEVRARGRSVAVSMTDLPSVLPLFIQRLGGFSRPPTGVVRTHVRAPAAVLGERFLILTGGERAIGDDGEVDSAFAERYDLMLMSGYTSDATLARNAKSMFVIDTNAVLIDDDGGTIQDLVEDFSSTELTPPSGFSFAEVSGGQAISNTENLDAPTFVVGPTRNGNPTDAVFIIDASGDITAVRLAAKRAGAAALYVDGVGLVIVGGSGDADAPGVETVTEDGIVKSLPYPADSTTGAAAALDAEQQIAVFGGRLEGDIPAPTRVLDLRCSTAKICEDKIGIVDDAPLPALATWGRAFVTPKGTLVTGESDDGETLAFLVVVATGAVASLPLREPRRGATALPAPNGTFALIGGETLSGEAAHTIELFFPE